MNPSPSYRPRSRSRSPHRARHHRGDRDRERSRERHTHRRSRSRSGSPHHHHRRRHHHTSKRDRDRDPERASATQKQKQPIILPFKALALTRHDLPHYSPMFGMYLDIQKGLVLEDLPGEEVKGRWKSFIRKWNAGELAEGWYDPNTLRKAQAAETRIPGPEESTSTGVLDDRADKKDQDVAEEDEEEYGPELPSISRPGNTSGPTIPSIQDLQLRQENAVEDARASRKDTQKQYRQDIRAHRTARRELEDEVAPRAEAGTRERQMEKRREVAAANRSFAESRRGGSPAEAVAEEDLMGSGENELEALKKAQDREQRKKNDREIKREEILRARQAEREERVQRYRQKEDETIGWLKTLAKQRFG